MPTHLEYITPEQVYSMALNGEEAALKTAVANGCVNIDELYTPTPEMLFPPVVFLAMQKQHQAVDILLRCGAHVRHAVFGAALAGDRITLERYLDMPGGTKQRAAEGAALGGQFELLSKIESEDWEQLDKSRIAFYLASKGYEITLQRYLDADASIQVAADGAALAGRFDLLRTLQSNGATDKGSTLFFLAQGSHRDQVFSYIQDGVDPQNAANGAALAGRVSLLNELTKRYSNLDQSFVIYFLAAGGHQTAVLEHPNIRRHLGPAASGAIRNRHMTLLERLNEIGKLDITSVITELTKAGHLHAALQYSIQHTTESEQPSPSGNRFFEGNPPLVQTDKSEPRPLGSGISTG